MGRSPRHPQRTPSFAEPGQGKLARRVLGHPGVMEVARAAPCWALAGSYEDPESSQYSSFLFRRMLIPQLDLSELEDLGLSDTPTHKSKDSSTGKMTGKVIGAEQEKNPEGDILLEYSNFNFWRAPIASVHSFELDLL
ncbi:protein AF1q-like [Octodon degus]|uniref:Protein AF1q n=1 Tax=Octodon degus TaxID=10160 RepID=A0A6P6D9M8_OCTDE|nr:protein AF1q-like [Octodon degus]